MKRRKASAEVVDLSALGVEVQAEDDAGAKDTVDKIVAYPKGKLEMIRSLFFAVVVARNIFGSAPQP